MITHMHTAQYKHTPGANTRRSAALLSSKDKGGTRLKQVMLVLLFSDDPETKIVLVRRFCVTFSVSIGELSSNPLLLRSGPTNVLFTFHLMLSAIAVHVKLMVLFSPALTDFGGTTIPT